MRSHLDEAACGPADELHILLKNTTNAPKAMIRDLLDNCYDDPDFDVEEVWEELERRFGSKATISRCLLQEVRDFKPIHEPSQTADMEKLASLCRSVRSKMKTCKDLWVLNYPSE